MVCWLQVGDPGKLVVSFCPEAWTLGWLTCEAGGLRLGTPLSSGTERACACSAFLFLWSPLWLRCSLALRSADITHQQTRKAASSWAYLEAFWPLSPLVLRYHLWAATAVCLPSLCSHSLETQLALCICGICQLWSRNLGNHNLSCLLTLYSFFLVIIP